MSFENTIVVDWGSTNFRAYRFGGDGAVAETHQAASGILSVTDGRFEAALDREIGGWITPSSEILLSGMITSRNGWHETPYVEAPATLADLRAGARQLVSARGARLRFLPGVAVRRPVPDVMRGEEIQVFGATAPDETLTVILPGTHSKWVQVAAGRITAFRTFLTGETFALLRTHSIIGRLIPPNAGVFDEAAFLDGVTQAQASASAGLLNDVFTARAGALLGDFPPSAIADRLSGLVIGHEIRSGLGMGWDSHALRLVGDAALGARYAAAFAALGLPTETGPAHAAVEGFRKLVAASAS